MLPCADLCPIEASLILKNSNVKIHVGVGLFSTNNTPLVSNGSLMQATVGQY